MTQPWPVGKSVLITGASRGIGAATALALAAAGADVVIHYHSKAARAEAIAEQVRAQGRRALTVAADLTDEAAVRAMLATVRAEFGRLDGLVLNASGGLERDRSDDPDYAMRINRDAQLWTLAHAEPLLGPGGRIVFVTSHWAHFYGRAWQYPAYEPVARSKHAGEQALLARLPELAAHGLRLVRVSGDVVEGTITPKLLDHAQPGMLTVRRRDAGRLPTVDDMAAAIVQGLADDTLAPAAILFVGETNIMEQPRP